MPLFVCVCKQRAEVLLNQIRYGRKDPRTQASRGKLGQELLNEGNIPALYREMRNFVRDEERWLNEKSEAHVDLHHNLALFLTEKGAHADAEGEYRQAFEAYERIHGLRDYEGLDILNHWIANLETQKKSNQALELAKAAWTRRLNAFGSNEFATRETEGIYKRLLEKK